MVLLVQLFRKGINLVLAEPFRFGLITKCLFCIEIKKHNNLLENETITPPAGLHILP